MPTEVIHTEPAPWVTDHAMHLFNQTESRPLPDGWMERQPTGLVLAVCNCGYNSGWIPEDQLPSRDSLLGEHGAPLTRQ